MHLPRSSDVAKEPEAAHLYQGRVSRNRCISHSFSYFILSFLSRGSTPPSFLWGKIFETSAHTYFVYFLIQTSEQDALPHEVFGPSSCHKRRITSTSTHRSSALSPTAPRRKQERCPSTLPSPDGYCGRRGNTPWSTNEGAPETHVGVSVWAWCFVCMYVRGYVGEQVVRLQFLAQVISVAPLRQEAWPRNGVDFCLFCTVHSVSFCL